MKHWRADPTADARPSWHDRSPEIDAQRLIWEQEDRLEAVQKEIYEPVAEKLCNDWTAIQSTIRRAAQTAWSTNPSRVQELAGYPLDGCPSAVQFLEMLYNDLARG